MSNQHTHPDINTLKNEALRLISIQRDLLGSIQNESILWAEEEQNDKKTLTKETISQHLEVFEGEFKKLEKLEMVLAVVGTMKAGKSTTINAIVGTEVLPNRNRPMTALPTLIRHTPGKTTPLLKFDHAQPIQELNSDLKKSLNNLKNPKKIQELNTNPGFKPLIEFIKKGAQPKTSYEGADSIFDFLVGLNDLVRLSKELDIPFPFEKYKNIGELPVIEVEFAHLEQISSTSGQLTLLDTPGFNEEGQSSELTSMLKDQLRKASAVLAVLNYRQLKSEADAKMRSLLQEITPLCKGRMYALVNQFDAKDSHGDTEEEVKVFVSQDLMKNEILQDNVFPVSSKWGYLANRARHELKLHQKLPNVKNAPWVKDFCEEALGRRWASKIDDIEEVQASADDLWEHSLFDAPLDKVIRAAHASAAVVALSSAADKLVDMSHKLSNFIGLRENAFKKTVEELNTQISSLQADISKIEESKQEAKKNLDCQLTELEKEIEALFRLAKTGLESDCDRYFKEGKKIEEEEIREQLKELAELKNQKKPNTNSFKHYISSFFSKPRDDSNQNAVVSTESNIDSEDRHFDPNDPIITHLRKEKIESIVQKIKDTLQENISSTEEKIKIILDKYLENFKANLQEEINQSGTQIIANIQGRLNEEGFANLHLPLPKTENIFLEFSGAKEFENVIQSKIERGTSSRRSKIWGTLCEWIGADYWGWETYSVNIEKHQIDIRVIQQSVAQKVQDAFDGLEKMIAYNISTPLKMNVETYFEEFKETVEEMQGDLLQGIEDKKKTKEEQDTIKKSLDRYKQHIQGISSDLEGLQHDVNDLKGA